MKKVYLPLFLLITLCIFSAIFIRLVSAETDALEYWKVKGKMEDVGGIASFELCDMENAGFCCQAKCNSVGLPEPKVGAVFLFKDNSDIFMCVDHCGAPEVQDLLLVKILATPTSTNTPTSTATFTPTPTNTPTPTPTNTPTSTPTNTATFTATATFTNTPTLTPTVTVTNTPTITPTSTKPPTGIQLTPTPNYMYNIYLPLVANP
jgi:hypothetical protein